MADAADDRAMTPQQLRDALQVSTSTFYHYQAEGRYEAYELVPRIGPRRYSRKLVAAYLNRDVAPVVRRLRSVKVG